MAGSAPFGGAGEALSSRNFRYYWMGNGLSILGFWLHKLALGVFTWELTESPFWLGAIGFAALFPAFILSPYAGAVADRFGMRRISSLALLVGAAAALGLWGFVLSGGTDIAIVFALTIVQGVSLAFDLPARQGLVPTLVARSNLSSAIALNTTTFHMGAFVGPALFGVMVKIFDLQWAFLMNSVSFVLFFFCLQALDIEERGRTGARDEDDLAGSITADIVDGFRYVRRHPGMKALFIIAILPHLFVRPFIDLLPGFSADVFGRGEEGVAVLAGSFGLGSFLFGVYLALRGKTAGLSRMNVLAIFAGIVLLFAFAATDIFWFAVSCLFFLGMSNIGFAVSNQSLLQNAVDRARRGRVISLSTGLAVGLPALGALILGTLAETSGLQVPVMGAMVIAVLYWAWASRKLLNEREDLERID